MLPRKWSWGLAALGAAWLAAPPAIARAESLAVLPGGAAARAGEVVPISWRRDSASSGAHDEMELVLSLDGGATFPIRVVSGLGPAVTTVDWRVPALPTRNARLALRAGEGGAAETEEIVAVSDAFSIVASRFQSLEPLYAVGDEWRTRDALEGAPARPAAGLAGEEGSPEVASRDLDKGEPETPPMGDRTARAADRGLVSAAVSPEFRLTVSAFAPRALRPLRL